MPEQTKQIRVETTGATMIVTPSDNLGELEFEELESEAQDIREQYQESDAKHLVVDLRNAEFLGSSTIGWLLDLRKTVHSRGGRMVLCGMSATGHEVLKITHLIDHWPVYASREDALAACGGAIETR